MHLSLDCPDCGLTATVQHASSLQASTRPLSAPTSSLHLFSEPTGFSWANQGHSKHNSSIMQALASSSGRCQACRPATAHTTLKPSTRTHRSSHAVRALPEALLFDCDGVSVFSCCSGAGDTCYQQEPNKPHQRRTQNNYSFDYGLELLRAQCSSCSRHTCQASIDPKTLNNCSAIGGSLLSHAMCQLYHIFQTRASFQLWRDTAVAMCWLCIC